METGEYLKSVVLAAKYYTYSAFLFISVVISVLFGAIYYTNYYTRMNQVCCSVSYSSTLIVIDLPSGHLALILPPCASTTDLAMARPMPLPPVDVFRDSSGR